MNNNNSTPDHQDQASKNSITDANNNIVNSLVPAKVVSGKGKSAVVQQIQRKRSSKRDRHSKRKSKRKDKIDESNSKQCNEGRTKTKLTWNPFETVVESAGTQTVNYHPSFDHVKLIHNEAEAAERTSQKAKEHHSHSHEDNYLFNMSKWSPTMMFKSLNNFQEEYAANK
ncbi:hypothetical protein RYX36_032893 [Vicia faba]